MDPGRAYPGDALIHRPRALGAGALVVILVALAAPSLVAAQSTDDYWRALQSEADAAFVLAAEAPANVPADLAEGLRLFRAYELTGDEGAARRARELLRRTEVEPELRAWHALALAMVYARGPDSRMRIGDDGDWITDPNSLGSARSLRLLRTALTARPHFREAALELGTWALDREHRATAAEAEIALAARPEDADVLITRAALALLLDRPARAAALAERALAAGADPSVAHHTRAWALMQDAAARGAGLDAYFAGARVLTDAGRREYARFLEPVLSLEESEDWRATPNERAGEWLERYWHRNAARAGVMPDERLVEHYRRLHRARIQFPNTAPLSVLQVQARFALGEDSRRFGMSLHGLMLLRHGDPYRLARIEACLSNPWPTSGQAGTVCHELGGNRTALMRNVGRLARGDSFDPFSRPLTLYWGVYAFRGAGATNDLVFAAGLPVRSANALIEGPDQLAGLISAVLLTDSGSYIRHDSMFSTTVPRFTDPLAGETDAVTLLFAVLNAPAEDATREFRLTLSDLNRAAGATARGSIALHDFSGFSVSDIVVAPETMPVGWQRGDASIAFAPLATYRPGETVRLYYEVYGLVEDAAYETEIELVPPSEGVAERMLDLLGRDRAVRFRFEGRADAPHPVHGQQQNRTIALQDVHPGMWTLRVRVTDVASGRSTERETIIEIATGP